MKSFTLFLIGFFIIGTLIISYQLIFPEKEDPNQFDFQAYTKERDDQIRKFLEEVK